MRRTEQVVRPTGEHPFRRAATRVAALLALASIAIGAQACREEEQNRPLVYEKGTYLGQVDEELDQEQVDALRQRAAQQQI